MPRKLDSIFWAKIGIGVSGLFLGILLMVGLKVTPDFFKIPSSKDAQEMTLENPKKASRVKIMCINCITIVFLFMISNEVRLYELFNPIGIDSSRFSSLCQKLRSSLFIIYGVIAILILYNFIIAYTGKYITTVTATDLDFVKKIRDNNPSIKENSNLKTAAPEKLGTTTLRNIADYNKPLANILGIIFARSTGCSIHEKFAIIFLCVASIFIFFIMVGMNYAIIGAPMRSCIHPPHTNAYVDIYDSSLTKPPTY
jgi:hypothetical protein